MEVGEAVANMMVDNGGVAIILVGVGWVCMVIATMVPTSSWSIIWVGEPSLLGRLHDERIATSKMDIDRSLNIFIFTFVLRNETVI